MLDIQNKWALVTGSSRGVGLRVARTLAEKGCKLILHSRSLEHTAELLKELSASGTECQAVAAELSSITEVSRLIHEVNSISANHLDILYNNAAIMTPYQPVFQPTSEEYSLSFFVYRTGKTVRCLFTSYAKTQLGSHCECHIRYS